MNVAVDTPQPWPTTAFDRHEAIRRRAEEIYIRNGSIPGRDTENWAQAEQEILLEFPASRKTAIVIRVNGDEFVGEYDPESANGYVPGEFGTGVSVPVRFHGAKMLVLRPNGKVLETKIVRKNRVGF